MSIHDDDEPPTSRSPLGLVILLVVVGAAGAVAWFVWSNATVRDAPPTSRPSSATRPPSATTPAPTPAAPPRDAARRASRPAPESPAAPAAAPEATRGVLRVRSDVAGASVFLDCKYLGTTPLEVDGLAPGSHQVNVSAEGHEGQIRTVEIGAEPAEVTIAFKDVRLDASVAVVHKHRMGSCQGRLAAGLDGLRYDTSSDDAFTLTFAEIEGFDVDYLQKNLRVRRRGGKTWNFTDPSGSADPLFVFHRDVEKARARLR